ncbi:MAG: YihA family ribosome biogenesis GTP-binding protein [Bacteroidia bacterium]|nr:YihA family ribosome biogenesis GTP-binding protein [Bacteroidia bacterium]
MIIKKAEYLISNTDVKKCPAPDKHEYAFIGRSNVGKSSLINMLTNRKSLAKTSVKPGKTKLINHFLINEKWYLVDLPGYGYAKVAKSEKQKWNILIEDYILKRKNLICLFLLLDSRLEPQKIDLNFMQWLGENNISFVMVFTKTDKLSVPQLERNLTNYKIKLLKSWETLPQIFITSATAGTGKEDILGFIDQTNHPIHEKPY